ncbi:MAG: hypothetical protein U1F65_08310 [Verrucomicrobiota bacterium]
MTTRKLLCALFSLAAGAALAKESAVVSVDVQKPGAEISPTALGLSYETSRLLPDEKGVHYFRPDNLPLVTLFQTLGIKSLRIGGNSVDAPLIAIPAETDVRLLFDFARAAGVKVIYSVRLLHGEPEQAEQVARFIHHNYADVLDGFAIGNEPDYYKDYEVYRARWTAIHDAILGACPEAKFFGPDQNPPSSKESGPDAPPNLFEKMVRDFGNETGRLACLTVHSYPFGCSYKNPGVAADDVLKLVPTDATEARQKMLSPAAMDIYEKIRLSMAKATAGTSLSYRLGEVNSYWFSGLKGASDSYASALWVVDYSLWWTSHGASGLNFHTGDKTGGAIMLPCRYAAFVTSSNGYTSRPLAYGLKLFDLGGHGKFLPVTIAAGTNENLSAYATLAEDKTVFVTVINKAHGPTATNCEISVQLNLPPAGSTIQTIQLTARDNDIAGSSADVLLGGSRIREDGTWSGKWQTVPVEKPDGFLKLDLPPASAAVISFSKDN